MIKTSISLTLLLAFMAQAAVHINPDESGQVAVIPFYTTANELNTLLLIENTRDLPKAVKVHIREARGGRLTHSFSLYINAHAAFAAALFNDLGVTRLASNTGQCLLGQLEPLQPDIEPDALPFSPATGTIEVIEMGEVIDSESEFFVTAGPPFPGFGGAQTVNCEALAAAWDGDDSLWGQDPTARMAAASGGLQAQASVIDVASGYMIEIPTLYLDGFAPGDGILHNPPISETPDLSSSDTTSLVVHNGEAITSTWPTGHQAIGALISHTRIENDFSLDASVQALSEWIFTFPTRRYYASDDTDSPFVTDEDGAFAFPGRFSRGYTIFNRAGDGFAFDTSLIDPPPPEAQDFYNTTVLSRYLHNGTPPASAPG